MGRITCPNCLGAGKLKDLNKTDDDLHYPPPHNLAGTVAKPRELPSDGFPALSCEVCHGQGWVPDLPIPFDFSLAFSRRFS